MSYFKVEQLLDLSFAGNLLYVLPESVKKMLIELDACLEITDANLSETVERKDTRRPLASETNVKYRNRYDFDSAPLGRGGGDRERGKKRDFRQKDSVSGSEWRNAGSASSVKEESSADAEWEMMRSFKATKIESKTGIEKTVNDVRIALNKISAANYDKQRDVVLGLVNGYFESSDEEKTEANTRRISKAIFDIASTNKFYSEMYAKLYKELVEAHSVFRELLEEMLDGFIQSLDSIPVYVDPDSDYDGFCAYSKACEIRKSTSTFIVNCLKTDLVEYHRVVDIVAVFVKYVDDKRSEDGFSKCVEEVVENIYIIATLCATELSIIPKWKDYVLPKIQLFVKEKSNGFPSMSNRAAFKFMDLLEKL
jgi:hypothetical protein